MDPMGKWKMSQFQIEKYCSNMATTGLLSFQALCDCSLLLARFMQNEWQSPRWMRCRLGRPRAQSLRSKQKLLFRATSSRKPSLNSPALPSQDSYGAGCAANVETLPSALRIETRVALQVLDTSP
ncbi:uncharacterized protein LOC132350874 isoform X10 [Balaenoptera ricei]|uniref:uncharacterized protein LOC132350874 isoform X10 n=1 Tax=Balaenoptera ricei TaxID=2746895 RepID=UPI0028BE7838|nr:uncharacterized protein LOC132350874 isoform X10 [Balaenoptera ricei]